MNTLTFEWNTLKIECRAETMRDTLDQQAIRNILLTMALDKGDISLDNAAGIIRNRTYWYARALTLSTVVEGKLSYPWPQVNQASADVFYQSFTEWLDKTPPNLWDIWRDTLEKVNQEVLDPEE
jgi:hypothetical protein